MTTAQTLSSRFDVELLDGDNGYVHGQAEGGAQLFEIDQEGRRILRHFSPSADPVKLVSWKNFGTLKPPESVDQATLLKLTREFN